jgi:hypothetical protein
MTSVREFGACRPDVQNRASVQQALNDRQGVVGPDAFEDLRTPGGNFTLHRMKILDRQRYSFQRPRISPAPGVSPLRLLGFLQ